MTFATINAGHLAFDRDARRDVRLAEIAAAKADCDAYAKANRAAIEAEWATYWDGRPEPLTAEQKRRAVAEWDAMDARGNLPAKEADRGDA